MNALTTTQPDALGQTLYELRVRSIRNENPPFTCPICDLSYQAMLVMAVFVSAEHHEHDYVWQYAHLQCVDHPILVKVGDTLALPGPVAAEV